MFDLVIKNAWVYDGTGTPPVQQDVAVQAGLISAIDTLGSFDTSSALRHRAGRGRP